MDIIFLTLAVFTSLSICQAFEVVWNAPIEDCKRFGIDIDVTKYNITANSETGWDGSKITIFYEPHMGLYPKVYSNQKVVNGGIPQKVNLNDHLDKCNDDIDAFIPNENFDGLGVIDYESWRPLWDRNFDSKKIYQTLSEQLVKAKHPDWSRKQVLNESKKEFESAARQFMLETLLNAKRQRPNGKWGYYLFPKCLNNYDRICSEKEKEYNNKLLWMFNASSGLFPSAYLPNSVHPEMNQNFVYRTIMEAKRVRNLVKSRKDGNDKPIHLYSRIRYRDNLNFYTKIDLENTIKQAHDLGIYGVVLWGGSSLGENQTICLSLKQYIDHNLGPFVQQLLSSGYRKSLWMLWSNTFDFQNMDEHTYHRIVPQRRNHGENRSNRRSNRRQLKKTFIYL